MTIEAAIRQIVGCLQYMPILESITLRNFKHALVNNHKAHGDSIIVGCYRRSGALKPTAREKRIVLEAEKMSESMGIQFVDFLILGKHDEYFSFWDARLLKKSKDDAKPHPHILTPTS